MLIMPKKKLSNINSDFIELQLGLFLFTKIFISYKLKMCKLLHNGIQFMEVFYEKNQYFS